MKFQLACAAAAAAAPTAFAMYADQTPFNTEVGQLRAIGNAFDNRLEEVATGYTVLRTPLTMDIKSPYVYATADAEGVLMASRYPVEEGVDPRKIAELAPGMRSRLTADQQLAMRNDADATQNAARRLRRSLQNAGGQRVLNNFILRIRFADHKERTLPGDEQFDRLMNGVDVNGNCDGEDEACSAPTGSVRDFYLEQSYGKLLIKSTVTAWIDLPNNEAVYGRDNRAIHRDVISALKKLDDDNTYDFTQFDQSGGGVDGNSPDGEIDMFTIFHSGYGAEWGKDDIYGTPSEDRVWSHKWTLNAGAGGSRPAFTTSSGVGFLPYNINPGVWGLEGSQIGHLGVVAHESAHYLGLPDLYDTDSSSGGLGSFGLMANSWGFDGSQYFPPSLSAWSKVSVGFAEATEVTETTELIVKEVHTNPQIFKFTNGYPENEYVLMEYRGNISSDGLQPTNGILFWKIDDLLSTNKDESYPASSGWPYKHYRVALLEADGLYELQKSRVKGDAGDVWVAGQELGDLTLPTLNNYNYIGCRSENKGLTGNTITIDSYNEAAGTFLVRYKKTATCNCNTECAEDNDGSDDGLCKNTPGWYDAQGPFFDCDWYAVGDRCTENGFDNVGQNGETAVQACCACGGGSTSDDNQDKCVDVPQGFYDSDGPVYSCAWYGEDKARCANYGDGYANFGTTANKACCSCGGGSIPNKKRKSSGVAEKTAAELAYAKEFATTTETKTDVATVVGTAVGSIVIGGVIGAFVATRASKKRVVANVSDAPHALTVKTTATFEDL